MLTHIIPKLPMRNQAATREYYIGRLGFQQVGTAQYQDYLKLQKDNMELHFFGFTTLDPLQNYGQVYIRLNDIDSFYHGLVASGVPIHPNGPLELKPWGQKEFSLLDPDHNLLTFGQAG